MDIVLVEEWNITFRLTIEQRHYKLMKSRGYELTSSCHSMEENKNLGRVLSKENNWSNLTTSLMRTKINLRQKNNRKCLTLVKLNF